MLLTTKDVSFKYRGGDAMSFPDVALAKGESWLLLGRSGSGKTTFLHLLAGLLTPVSGQIEMMGQDLARMNQSERDRFRGKHIGIVFQKPHYVRALGVEENLRLARSLAGLPPAPAVLTGLLERLQIGHYARKQVSRLSEGEKQRFSIALALSTEPALLLADEPTSSLDDQNCQEVLTLLQTQAALHHSSLFIITHDQRLKDQFPHQIQL